LIRVQAYDQFVVILPVLISHWQIPPYPLLREIITLLPQASLHLFFISRIHGMVHPSYLDNRANKTKDNGRPIADPSNILWAKCRLIREPATFIFIFIRSRDSRRRLVWIIMMMTEFVWGASTRQQQCRER